MRGVKTKESGKWKRASVFLALLVLLAALLNSVNKVYQKKKEAGLALYRMQEEARELGERERSLKESLAKLETDEGLKFEMRKKLNVAEVGERVAIIVENGGATENPKPNSIWQKIKYFFEWLFE